MSTYPICLVIPTYNPKEPLIDILRELTPYFQHTIVINDGSDNESSLPIIQSVSTIPSVILLHHEKNQGKGKALKTGFNYISEHIKDAIGVVTADDDGQHSFSDIKKIADNLTETPLQLIMGARYFDADVPFRSRFGNSINRYVFQIVAGIKLTDTMTGLRGIPFHLLSALSELPSDRYEFELDMLIYCKQQGVTIREVPIKTLYFNQNKASHFSPLLDSMRIYLFFFKHLFSSRR